MKGKNRGTVSCRTLPDMQSVQVVRGQDVENEFPRHVHSSCCIGLVERGVRLITHKGTTSLIPTNGIFVINPGTPHACRPYGQEQSYAILCIAPEQLSVVVAQITSKPATPPHFKKIALDDAFLAGAIRQFIALVENTSSFLARETALLTVLSALILRYGEAPIPSCRRSAPHRAIPRVCDFIQRNCATEVTLAQLSTVADLSPYYFHRLFLAETGLSPHEYLVQIRIKKAQHLLLAGHEIAAVALDTGFVDQSHLTRWFRRVTGVTPGRYLANAGKIRGDQSAAPSA